MRTQWDIVIIGAGPAGMSAALQATRHELSVLVLDRQAEPGGQIFRSAGSASADKRKQIGADYARGEALVREFRQSPATFLGGANVWHLAPGRAYVSHQGTSHVMQARQILIATGAMERPVPLPGWTLPGVLGAGAADVLLKSASMLPKARSCCAATARSSQTVVHLKHFGIPIAGVALTGSPPACSGRAAYARRAPAPAVPCTAWAWACAPSSARPATPPQMTFPSAGTAKR
ncbi:MAG: NAD(P)/FAD-dependent oxidoreductase [Bilophila wadsworthia]